MAQGKRRRGRIRRGPEHPVDTEPQVDEVLDQEFLDAVGSAGVSTNGRFSRFDDDPDHMSTRLFGPRHAHPADESSEMAASTDRPIFADEQRASDESPVADVSASLDLDASFEATGGEPASDVDELSAPSLAPAAETTAHDDRDDPWASRARLEELGFADVNEGYEDAEIGGELVEQFIDRLARVRDVIAAAHDEYDTAIANRDQVRSELAAAEAARDEALREVELVGMDLSSSRAELDRSRGDVALARAELDQARNELTAATDELEETRNDLASSNSELVAVESRRKAAVSRWAEHTEKLARLREAVAETETATTKLVERVNSERNDSESTEAEA